jgi:hypothetical protein
MKSENKLAGLGLLTAMVSLPRMSIKLLFIPSKTEVIDVHNVTTNYELNTTI